MKTNLTPEQSQRLIELGVTPSNASEVHPYSDDVSQWTNRGDPIFTLFDILSLLPKEIDGYPLLIFSKRFFEETDKVDEGWTVLYTNNDLTAAFGDKGIYSTPELIDALFELLVWVLQNHPDKIKRL